jgi:tetratricopeptide (TPR) repeat protein
MTLESVSSPPPASPGPGGGLDAGRGEVAPPLPPPAASERIPPPEAAAPQLAPGPGWLDWLFAGIVCALAFLLASTPSHNSDLWLHLAFGRALVNGQAPFGTDPFASTTAGVYWVNHSWLSDAVLYALYEIGDGAALAIAKASLVAALAGLFFCFRRRRTRTGLVALAAAAAVLALGPWLLLQPALASLLGTALTLYLLERPDLVETSRVERARSLRWLLVPLFALWANLDGWFLLGPVLVGLYAAGAAARSYQGSYAPRSPGEFRSLALLALAGLAACFLTPFHYHTFAWPVPLGLSHAEQAWMRDPLGQGLVVSPFAPTQPSPRVGGGLGGGAPAFASAGGWAYCLLLAAGAASFVLRGKALHPGRLLVWLALAGLSAYQARAVPFFAAAAGPILALNLQEWSRSAIATERRRRLAAAMRAVGPLAGLVLLVAAWPGWLQPTPYQPRSWAVEPDETLVRLARRIDQQHADHPLRSDRCALTFSPEVAHYLAWFCPSEKGFLDSRLSLFDQTADDFVQMRRCLLRPDGSGPDGRLGPLLDAHRIDRILLYEPDAGRTHQAFRCLLLDGEEWELLDIQGGAAVFGRRSGAASPWKALDLRQGAYHPDGDRQAPQTAPPMPQPPGLFDAFRWPHNEHSADRGEAALYLVVFDMAAEQRRQEMATQWLLAQATGLVGSPPGSEPAGTASALAVRLHMAPFLPESLGVGGQPAAEAFAAGFAAAQDRGPPEALLLAVRAARRALAAYPDDAGAFLLLGEAYVRLASQPREQRWQAALPSLASARRSQALTALEQAVALRPDLDRAHTLLAQLYYQDNQLDRALDHLRARLRIAEQEIAARGPEAASAADRRVALAADVDTMDSLVEQAEKIYEANTVGKTEPSKVLDRASLAARHGLSRKALDMLLESHPAIFGKSGLQLQLELMMKGGRASDVHAWLEPQHEDVLGFRRYHLLQAEAAAASGDYAAADAELDTLSEQLRQVGISGDKFVPVRSAIAFRVGDAALARSALDGGPAGLVGVAFFPCEALRPLGAPADLLRQEADIRVLRGLLAVESGAVGAADEQFQAALEVWGGDRQAAAGAGLDFASRPIAQQMIRLLEESRVPSP